MFTFVRLDSHLNPPTPPTAMLTCSVSLPPRLCCAWCLGSTLICRPLRRFPPWYEPNPAQYDGFLNCFFCFHPFEMRSWLSPFRVHFYRVAHHRMFLHDSLSKQPPINPRVLMWFTDRCHLFVLVTLARDSRARCSKGACFLCCVSPATS